MENLNKDDAMIGKIFKTNNCGECFIIDYKNSKNVTVMFYDGFIKRTALSELRRGKVKKQGFSEKYIGMKFKTKFHGECEVISYENARNVRVKFNDGTIVKASMGNINSGLVMNPNNGKIFGVAINDNYSMTGSKWYTVWHSLIRRCYSEVYQKSKPTYKDVEVESSWLRFSNFLKDVVDIPFCEKCENGDYQLDKDVLSNGLKIYSKETVCFVPPEINAALIRSGSIVGYRKCGKRYIPSFRTSSLNTIANELGLDKSYRTSEEALQAYRKVKLIHLENLANKYKGEIDERVYNTLVNFDFDSM